MDHQPQADQPIQSLLTTMTIGETINSTPSSIIEPSNNEDYSSSNVTEEFFLGKLNWPIGKVYAPCFEFKQIESEATSSLGVDKLNQPKKGRGCIAMRDIEKCETILIDTSISFPSDHCFNFVESVTKNSNIHKIFNKLYPCDEVPISKDLTKEYKEKVRIFNEYWNEDLKQRKLKANLYNKKDVDNLISKIILNSFGNDEVEYMFCHLSYFNHSCDPNSLPFYEGNMCILKAIRQIKKGEEICISYMDFFDSRLVRSIKLLEHNFSCRCPRCSELGEWKEKTLKVEGFNCPKCGKCIGPNIDAEGDYVCGSKCPKTTRFKIEYKISDYLSAFELLSPLVEKPKVPKVAQLDDLEPQIRDIVINKKKLGMTGALEKLRDYAVGHFSELHVSRIIILPALCFCYYLSGKLEQFNSIVSQLKEVTSILPSRRLYHELYCLIKKLLKFKYELNDEFLKIFENFGLSLNESRRIFGNMTK